MAVAEVDTVPTHQPDTRCHLLRVPPELRLRIYENVFDYKLPLCKIYISRYGEAYSDHKKRDFRPKSRFTGALLGTCKLIYREAQPVFARCAYVAISISNTDYYKGYLTPRGPMRKALRFMPRVGITDLCVEVGNWHHCAARAQHAYLLQDVLKMLNKERKIPVRVRKLMLDLEYPRDVGRARAAIDTLKALRCQAGTRVLMTACGASEPEGMFR